MSGPRLTLDNALTMRQMVLDGDRTRAYIYYHQLSGSQQILEHAQTSQFSGFIGGTADVANRVAQFVHPNYPEEGVFAFSQQIALDLADRIVADVRSGGTGVFTDRQLRKFTREVWDRNGLHYIWPGDIHDVSPTPFFPLTWTPGAAIAAGSAAAEIVTLGRLFGHARTEFTDLNRYEWSHIKPYRTNISYAIDRKTKKVVYIERSRFGALMPSSPAYPSSNQGPAQDKPTSTGPVSVGPRRDGPRQLPLTPEQRDIALFMKQYGLKESDITPEIKSTLIKAARIPHSNAQGLQQTLTAWSTITHDLEQFALAANKPKVLHAAQIGIRVIDVLQQTSALPGAIVQAPNALAALHPMLGLATAAFSLAGLLKGHRGAEPMEQLMKRIQGIENRLAEMHRDLIEGINLLAAGQMQIYSTMLERFAHIETVIQQQSERLGTAIISEIARLESYLTFVHADLSDQIQRLYLQRFYELEAILRNAISPTLTRATRKSRLADLARRELVSFEGWLTREAGSDMLNGYRFISFFERLAVKSGDAQKLIQRKLISDHGVRLECFVGYLGQLATDTLKANPFGPNLTKLVNPVLWLVGASTYVEVLQNVADLEIEHDPTGAMLDEICQKGAQYKEFISTLQKNAKLLFEGLLEKHRASVNAVVQRGRSIYFSNLRNLHSLQNNAYFQTSSSFVFDESKIRTVISTLQLPILNRFIAFREVLNADIKNSETHYFEKLEQIISGVNNNFSREQLSALLDRPIAPYARSKPNSAHGENYLDMWHAQEHWSRFDDLGFKTPLVLTALFENSPELKISIPKILYLAEMLGIGNFEITAIAKYTHPNMGWTKPEQASLNNKGYYNYRYTFEVFFLVNTVRTKICEFDCTSEQLSVTEDMLATAEVCAAAQQRIGALHKVGAVSEYWLVGILSRKAIVMSQVPRFRTVQRCAPHCTPQLAAQLEQSLAIPIDAKLKELRLKFQEFYSSSLNHTQLRDQLEDVESSQNLVLAYLHLCGFENAEIDNLRGLWSLNEIFGVANHDQNMLTLLSRQQAAAEDSLKRLLTKIPSNALKGFKVAEVDLMLNLLATAKAQQGHRLELSQDEVAEAKKLLQSPPAAPKPQAKLLTILPTVDRLTVIRRITKNAQLIFKRQSSLTISEAEQTNISKKIEKSLNKSKYDALFSKIGTEQAQLRLAELIAIQAQDPRIGLRADDKKLHGQVIRSAVEKFLQEMKLS